MPTIRVSHVDEPAALEHAAEQAGVSVDELSVNQRVMILAEAKAQAVYQAYRNVAEAAAAATGERVTAYPLKAAGVGDAGSVPSSSDPTAVSTSASSSASPASGVTGGKASDITRDFSGVDVPTTVEPIHTPRMAPARAVPASTAPMPMIPAALAPTIPAPTTPPQSKA